MADTDSSNNDKLRATTVSTNGYSEMRSLKMQLLHQSLKRGLGDLNSGKVQCGDSVFDSMLDADGNY